MGFRVRCLKMNEITETNVTATVYPIWPSRPIYKLKRKLGSKRSLLFAFDTPDGELVVKLPKFKLDSIGRSCQLSAVCFYEGIYEIVPAPIYWPVPPDVLTRAPKSRPERG